MKTISGKDFCKLLEEKDWVLKIGLLRAMMKIADIKESEL